MTEEDQILIRIEQAEKRLDTIHEQREIFQKIQNDLFHKDIWHYKFYRVPKNYYDLSLPERASLLGGNATQLCKSIIFENTACSHDRFDDVTDSRYYLVIVQYMSKINPTLLRNFVHSLKPLPSRLSKSSFNLQLANEEDSFRFSGFSHNAVSPYGMNMTLPVLLDSKILEVKPNAIYLGGGFVDVKLLISVPDVMRSLQVKVGSFTESR